MVKISSGGGDEPVVQSYGRSVAEAYLLGVVDGVRYAAAVPAAVGAAERSQGRSGASAGSPEQHVPVLRLNSNTRSCSCRLLVDRSTQAVLLSCHQVNKFLISTVMSKKVDRYSMYPLHISSVAYYKDCKEKKIISRLHSPDGTSSCLEVCPDHF